MLLDLAARGRALVAATAVEDRCLGEVDRPVRRHVRVEVEVVTTRVDELGLGPRGAGIVRLGHPWVTARRPVERDVHVDAVVAHGNRRLVVPRHVAVDRDRRRPRRPVVRRLGEHDVVAVHVRGVDRARVRDDLDDRVELARPLAGTERLRRAPRRPAVGADPERDERRRAVPGAGLVPVARDERVDPGRAGVGRDRRLPVVGHVVDGLLPGPADSRRGRRGAGRTGLPGDALLLGLLECLVLLLGLLALLGRLRVDVRGIVGTAARKGAGALAGRLGCSDEGNCRDERDARGGALGRAALLA